MTIKIIYISINVIYKEFFFFLIRRDKILIFFLNTVSCRVLHFVVEHNSFVMHDTGIQEEHHVCLIVDFLALRPNTISGLDSRKFSRKASRERSADRYRRFAITERNFRRDRSSARGYPFILLPVYAREYVNGRCTRAIHSSRTSGNWIIRPRLGRFQIRIDRAEESIILYRARTIYDSSRREIAHKNVERFANRAAETPNILLQVYKTKSSIWRELFRQFFIREG